MRAPRLPAHIVERAADSGGFVAMRRWGGEYQYTPEQYIAWLRTFRPVWAATFDFCCEPAIAADEKAIALRQRRTTEMARRFFDEYRDEEYAWVPTIQGWEVADYVAHAAEIRPLTEEMAAHYGPELAWRVGIGTLCQRADARMVRAIVGAVSRVLPEGTPLHLWGVTQRVLSGREALPGNVVSVDSSAWNSHFGPQIEVWRSSGLSQREYGYKVALPAYLDRFYAATSGPKQTTLNFFEAPE